MPEITLCKWVAPGGYCDKPNSNGEPCPQTTMQANSRCEMVIEVRVECEIIGSCPFYKVNGENPCHQNKDRCPQPILITQYRF